MVIKKRNRYKEKDGFETWLDISFPEKLVSIMWCGLPYMIWLMLDNLSIIYKLVISIGIWILLTLLCLSFGKFMGSGDRYWN
tara:strand:- start:280 stop:525 length:246 start_codon:yes stop_codon:yes gene_type:complete